MAVQIPGGMEELVGFVVYIYILALIWPVPTETLLCNNSWFI